MAAGALTVGTIRSFSGDFTELSALIFRRSEELEDALGFHRGRLGSGYSLLLLKERPVPGEVAIRGMTNSSGGRVGLPAATQAEDNLRPYVDEEVQREHHAYWDSLKELDPDARDAGRAWDDYRALQNGVNSLALVGLKRAAKIVPNTRHDSTLGPSTQYPPGGGVPQLHLKTPRNWLVAINVDANGDWEVPAGWPPVTRKFLDNGMAVNAKITIRELMANL